MTVFLQHDVSIFGGDAVIEIVLLLSSIWLHLPRICYIKTPFYPQSHWQLSGPDPTSDHDDFSTNPTSVTDICQIPYAYHAIKGNLSDVCRQTSRCGNSPGSQQNSASFTPVMKLSWCTREPSNPPKVNSLHSKMVYVCVWPHWPRESEWCHWLLSHNMNQHHHPSLPIATKAIMRPYWCARWQYWHKVKIQIY